MQQRSLIFSLIGILFFINGFSKDYHGAEIYSRTAVKYGRFEMSMKSGVGSGLLFTFFLYKGGSEQPGAFWEEIDIEIFGKNSARTFQSNIITDGVSGANKMSEKHHTYPYSLSDAFHTYALEWTPTYVAWFFDGKEVRRDQTAQVATLVNAQSIRFNAWISSSSGWAGAFNPAVLPQKQIIDWFKYSSYDETVEGNFKLEWVDDFNTFNTQRWAKANWTFSGNQVDFAPENAYIEDSVLVLGVTDERVSTSLDELSPSLEQAIYPNPATSQINLHPELSIQYDNFTIYNLLGAVVKNGVLSADNQTIMIDALQSGIYMIRFTSKTSTVSYKFLKQD